MNHIMKLLGYLLVGIIAAVLVLAIWPYTLVASPYSKLRIVDDSDRPLTGVVVVRMWNTSEGQGGEAEAMTDGRGEVTFKRVAVRLSMLKRLTKPLLAYVPAPCGLNWEIYGYSEFRIHWPNGYTLMFDGTTWERKYEVYENRDGVCVRDPEVVKQFRHQSYVELYFFNELNQRRNFDYTLTVYREGRK